MFRRLFERTGEAVILASLPGGVILRANEAALRLLDAPAAGTSLADVFHGDRERLRAHLERTGERGEAGPDEFQGAVRLSLTSSAIDAGGSRAALCVARRL